MDKMTSIENSFMAIYERMFGRPFPHLTKIQLDSDLVWRYIRYIEMWDYSPKQRRMR